MRKINRKNFLRTAALGMGAAALPRPWFPHTAKRLNVGHTAITWGYSPEKTEQAVKDVASAGFHSFECFGNALEYWEERGELRRLLSASGLDLRGVYCPVHLTDVSGRKDQLVMMVNRGRLLKKYGGTVAVIGPNRVNREKYNFNKYKADIVTTLNELGRALGDVGVTAALHQHKDSCIESRDELYAIMDAVDTRYVKLCPDFGHLYNGGMDPIQVLEDFMPVIAHVHVKDYEGGKHYNGYCPLGEGKIDIAGALRILEKSDKAPNLLAELNPPPDTDIYSPLELIQINKVYLKELGYTFRA